MRKIRVAHVITRLCEGGAQENTFRTVQFANKDRFQVDLISGPAAGQEGSLEPAVSAANIEILHVPPLVREIAPIKDLRAMRTLTNLFRENEYDLVHTHTSKAGFLGRWAARRAGTPIVVHTPHGNIFDGYFPSWLTWAFVRLERRAAMWTDRIVELTEGGIDDYLNRGIGQRDQYTAIFSGIDLSYYEDLGSARRRVRKSLGVGPEDVLIGGVGRLEPVKGFTYFIAASEIVAKAAPNCRFVLAGQGALDGELKAQAAPLGDRFRFLGQRGDVPELMAALDILVVPSLNEGMGRVILEAGAARTPVVAAAVGGIPEVVEDSKTGVLIPPHSPGPMAEVLIALAREPERVARMGADARAHIVPRFGQERMVMRIESLYEELIEEKGLDP